MRDYTESVRIVRLEVSTVDGDWKATTNRWHEQREQCQAAANMFWQQWEAWHVRNDSVDKIEEWVGKRRELHTARDAEIKALQSQGKLPKDKRNKIKDAYEKKLKAVGKMPVDAIPASLSKLIYKKLHERFASLHGRLLDLLMNRIASAIKKRKASNGTLAGWIEILRCREGRPGFRHPQPILFDIKNGKPIIGHKKGNDVFQVSLRTQRRASDPDVLTLWSGGRRVQSQINVFKKIVAGEFLFRGSSLVFEDGKWFVMLSYRRPVHRAEGLDPNKTAWLIPSRHVPFSLRFPGDPRKVWLQSRGEHIEAIRQQVFLARRSRSANYRNATARKGKGREHANRWRDMFARKWFEFVKRVNHAVSHDAVKQCIDRGYGKLVYLKPGGAVANHRAVSRLGATDYDQSSWEFFQLKTMLAYKCQDVGIEFECIEFNGKEAATEAA